MHPSGISFIIVVFSTIYDIFIFSFSEFIIIASFISLSSIFCFTSSNFKSSFVTSNSYPKSICFKFSNVPSNTFLLSIINNLFPVLSPLNFLIKFGTLKPITIKIKMINVDIINDFLLIISFIVNFITVKISLINIHLPFL